MLAGRAKGALFMDYGIALLYFIAHPKEAARKKRGHCGSDSIENGGRSLIPEMECQSERPERGAVSPATTTRKWPGKEVFGSPTYRSGRRAK
jgi:hypothetical protein